VTCRQEAEQSRLELEMQKRRERIEQWRAARKAKQDDATTAADTSSSATAGQAAARKWTLEDEAEEDEDTEAGDDAAADDVTSGAGQNRVAALHEDDVDPLDAYMQVAIYFILVPAAWLGKQRGRLYQW